MHFAKPIGSWLAGPEVQLWSSVDGEEGDVSPPPRDRWHVSPSQREDGFHNDALWV